MHLLLGPGEDSHAECSARGSGTSERDNSKTDWEKHRAGEGKPPAEITDHLPNSTELGSDQQPQYSTELGSDLQPHYSTDLNPDQEIPNSTAFRSDHQPQYSTDLKSSQQSAWHQHTWAIRKCHLQKRWLCEQWVLFCEHTTVCSNKARRQVCLVLLCPSRVCQLLWSANLKVHIL